MQSKHDILLKMVGKAGTSRENETHGTNIGKYSWNVYKTRKTSANEQQRRLKIQIRFIDKVCQFLHGPLLLLKQLPKYLKKKSQPL